MTNDDRAGQAQFHTTPDANTCSPLTAALTPDEAAALSDCEAALDRYESASLDAGRALRAIRDRRLYRGTHGTFEAYVIGTRTFDVRRAQQLMAAVEVVDGLVGAGFDDPPRNEAQARPLVGLPAPDRYAVWGRSLDEHGSAAALSKAKVEATLKAHRGDDPPPPKSAPAGEPSLEALTADWPDDARRVLRTTNKAHRPAAAAFTNGLGVPVTAEVVREVVEGYRSAVLEDGDVPGLPELAGAAREHRVEGAAAPDGSGTPGDPITEIGVLADRVGYTHPPAKKAHSLFAGAPETRPLLVALPAPLVPGGLLRGVPAGVSQVVVEVGELERAGGPVKDGVLLLDELRGTIREVGVRPQLQRTNESVDWARFTTNPLTGCWHGCRSVFCYAAGIAQRLFPQGFAPTLYPGRLDHFRNTKVPDVSGLGREEAWRERSVFCVSMGDLFGSWVPAWYVQAVLDEVRAHPEWFVFFLSKHPKRLADFSFPPNSAVGLTLTGDEPHGSGKYSADQRVATYAKYARDLGATTGAAFTWISLEPFRADVGDLSPFFESGVEMVAVGGQSRTSFSPAMQPELRWVDSVRAQVRAGGVHLFEKENLMVRPKEIPFPAAVPV